MRHSLYLALALFTTTLFGQSSISADQYTEIGTFEEFQQGRFQTVIAKLRNQASISEDEEIMLLLSQLKVGGKKEKEIELWISENEQHPLNTLAYYHLGTYFYYETDSIKSKKYLSKVSANNLPKKERGTYGFVYGLIQLGENNYKSAQRLFQLAQRANYGNEDQLNYYKAYAAYHLEDYEKALQGFEEVKADIDYGTSSKFFIAKIQLDRGEIESVIELSQSELSDDKTVTNSGFHQLIGEAYAVKGDKHKADAYFQRATDLHPEEPTAALYYQAGVSKFKIGDEDKAIAYLTRSGIKGGEYAQLSAFQLGRLFLQKREYEKSLSAYIEASVSENKRMQEESIFQVAKISAELGNYSEAINYSNDYLKLFRNGDEVESLQDLIAQSYLRTSNYDLAIEHLTQVGITNATQQSIYQKVTFQKAIQLFNDAEFVESKKWFRESLKFTSERGLADEAHYHLGEIAMRSNQFERAIESYQSQSSINSLSSYGIGYAYFNMQNYQKAIPHFSGAGKSVNNQIKLDSKVRLADCLYAIKAYNEALEAYDEVSLQTQSSYIIYQMGVTLKNLDRSEEAQLQFSKIFGSSKYGDDALFQSGMIHFEAARFNESESMFTQVINQFSDSPLLLESLLNRGISRKNLLKYDVAQKDYESILEKNIGSDEAINAILGLQELQQAGREIKKLDKYVSDYKLANPGSGSLELIEFESAKRFYFNFSYSKASEAFEKYLKDYPASGNKQEAQYFLGDSYYRLGKIENSLEVLNDLKFVRNVYTGRILSRLGDVNRQLGNIEQSKEAYSLLKNLNLTAKDTYNALSGLLELYYSTSDYVKSIEIADEILRSEWKPLNGDQEAILIKAKSYWALDQKQQAVDQYRLLSDGSDVYGAEANYHLGLYKYELTQYDESLNILFDLNSNYGSYQKWVDQSYLLIAKNYIAKDELFQAKATLRSIIQHSDNEHIKSESEKTLKEIESNKIQNDTTRNED